MGGLWASLLVGIPALKYYSPQTSDRVSPRTVCVCVHPTPDSFPFIRSGRAAPVPYCVRWWPDTDKDKDKDKVWVCVCVCMCVCVCLCVCMCVCVCVCMCVCVFMCVCV